MSVAPRRPVKLGEVLQEQVRALGWERRLREEQALTRWEEAVGPQIAACTRPLQLAQGRLTVAVESPVWAQQLSLLRRELLRRLSGCVGPGLVTELYFVSGPLAPRAPREQAPVPSEAPLPELPAELEGELAAIADADLRAALRRIGRRALRRAAEPAAPSAPGGGRRPRSPSGSR